jgi:hypothetical protein
MHFNAGTFILRHLLPGYLELTRRDWAKYSLRLKGG